MYSGEPTPIFGNTSAHAEKRSPSSTASTGYRKYLRARGEETVSPAKAAGPVEIPPRTRRRAHEATGKYTVTGNTSAHAEKRLLELLI